MNTERQLNQIQKEYGFKSKEYDKNFAQAEFAFIAMLDHFFNACR